MINLFKGQPDNFGDRWLACAAAVVIITLFVGFVIAMVHDICCVVHHGY